VKSGVKTIKAIVQSISSTIHNYIMMPIISADGFLFSPLHIVLKEPMGIFGSC